MQVGDKIAIKSSYTKSKDIPFENNGETVSVMKIITLYCSLSIKTSFKKSSFVYGMYSSSSSSTVMLYLSFQYLIGGIYLKYLEN